MRRFARAKTWWLGLTAGLFAISLALPALVHEGEATLLGARAAGLALFIPVLRPEPLGFLLGMLYPLLAVTLYGVLRSRPFATGAAIALLATMTLWGLSAPALPRVGVFDTPGGSIGWGFWLWLAAGACLALASLERGKPRFARWTRWGLAYAAIALVSGLTILARDREANRPPTEAEQRERLAQKL